MTQETLAQISDEIQRTEDLIRRGSRDEADEAVAAFNDRTGHTYTISDFLGYEEWTDLGTFALAAARPAWPRVVDITTDELVEIVRRIQEVDPETDYYLLLLQANSPHLQVGDLIFHPPAELVGASAAAIVAAALARRPIAL